jgi:hypothetical protein
MAKRTPQTAAKREREMAKRERRLRKEAKKAARNAPVDERDEAPPQDISEGLDT